MARTLAGAVRKLKPIDAGGTDHDLLARHVETRDDEAFATLVRRHGRTVLAACRQVLTDPAAVDDAFQATFVVLMKKAGSVARGPGLGSWLYAVAHRLAVNARRTALRRAAHEATAVRVRYADRPADEVEQLLLEHRSRTGKEAVTDAAGRFTIGQLIPGRTFFLFARTKGGGVLAPKPGAETTFTATPGGVTDCGTVSLPAGE
jgi:hypothetical protein